MILCMLAATLLSDYVTHAGIRWLNIFLLQASEHLQWPMQVVILIGAFREWNQIQ